MNVQKASGGRPGNMGTMPASNGCPQPQTRSAIMWTKPAATEMRFGFEVTMYVCNR